MDSRPRTLGEILDDACRLALADAPLLLLFNTVFLVPSFMLFMLLLAQPAQTGVAQLVLPTLTALSLPLMGLASGACQEVFRRRTAREPVSPRACLIATLRHGLEHTSARALMLCLMLPGPLMLLCLFLPHVAPIVKFLCLIGGFLSTFLLTLPLWTGGTSLHVLLNAGKARTGTLLSDLRRDVAAAPGKSTVLALSRLPLLLLLVIELHLLLSAGVWVAQNLAGFDLTMLDVELHIGNTVYTMALLLFAWLVLAPFFEAGNFLLHSDIRTRQEGLDLQYRVQRAFGNLTLSPAEITPGSRRGAKVGAVLVLLSLVLLCQPAWAQEGRLETLRSVRQEIVKISQEVKAAEPYPGGQRWVRRLSALEARLTKVNGDQGKRLRWFSRAVAEFPQRKRDDALLLLEVIQRRLSLLEESLQTTSRSDGAHQSRPSPEDVKSFLRGSEGRKVELNRTKQRTQDEREEKKRDEARDEVRGEAPEEDGPPRNKSVRVSTPGSGVGGFSMLGWLLLGGLALAVVAVGIFLFLISPRSPRQPKPVTETGQESPLAENDARQVLEESPSVLWQQAETLAGQGRHREAVRLLYLAILALLHRQHLIRFEPTRTNGEYVRQVRLAENAPPELVDPFAALTNRFESAWYGERPCAAGDFDACRTVAETIRGMVRGS